MTISYEANVLCDGLPGDRECPKNGIITTEPSDLASLDINAITRYVEQHGWKVMIVATTTKGSIPIVLRGKITKLHHSAKHGKSRFICPACYERHRAQNALK